MDYREKDSKTCLPSSDRRSTTALGNILMVVNILFGLLGCVVMGGGVFLVVDKTKYSEPVIGTSLVHDGALLMTIGGSLSIVVSVLGCCAAQTRLRPFLVVFLVLITVVFMLEWSAAVLAIVFRTWITEQTWTYMRNTLQTEYGLNDTQSEYVTNSWDMAQQKWYCCAVEEGSWGVYRQSEWYTFQPGIPEADKPLVPLSCCRKDQYGVFVNTQKCQTFLTGPPGIQSGQYNEAIFYRGCYDAGVDILHTVSSFVIAFGVVIYLLSLSLIIAFIWLWRLA